MKKNENFQLDDLDKKILNELIQSKNLTYSKLSQKLYVSLGTIHQRIKKMEAAHIIQGIQVKLNYQSLGYSVISFLGIYLEKSSLYDKVASELTKIPEVVRLNYTTGYYSIFAELVCKDIQSLKDVLHDKVQKISGISRTETFVSLDQTLSRSITLELTE